MMLTPQERDKFVIWLTQNANDNEGLVKEMEKLVGTGPNPMRILIMQKKTEGKACQIVARLLENLHFETIT